MSARGRYLTEHTGLPVAAPLPNRASGGMARFTPTYSHMESVVARVPSSAPVAFEDGLGQRRVAVGVDGGTLELLTLRATLTAMPAFEFALRDRISRLAAFQSDRYTRVHGVEKIGTGGGQLALVSDHVPGVRLAELLSAAESRLLPIETNAALSLVRQLVHAVAALHDRAPDLCHGAIGPERIVITPNARLVLVEHVLGAAIEQLRYSNTQYWRELRVPLPRTIGAPHFDRRTDVTQVGATALALIVGRPLSEDEYPDGVSDMTSGAISVAPGGGIEPLPLPLRVWLQRALQIDSRTPFGSAPEARGELDRVLHYSDPIAELEALKLFLAGYQASLTVGARPAASPPRSRPVHVETPTSRARPPAPPAVPAAAPAPAARASASLPQPAAEPAGPGPEADATASEEPRASRAPGVLRQAVPVLRTMPKILRAMPRDRLVAAAVLLVVLTSGGTIAGRRLLISPSGNEMGTLVVHSNPSGARVAIDDEERGVTPLNMELAAGRYTLTLTTEGNVRSMPITMAGGAYMSQFIELPRVSSVLGELRVQTDPPGARVSVDGHAYGTSPVTVEGLPPGRHAVVLETDRGRMTHQVRIEPGTTASLVVPLGGASALPASGWVSVRVPVALEVYADGRLLGNSAGGRIPVPAGRHELLLVSQELGYAKNVVVEVAPGDVTTVPVTWPTGSLAVNAAPWAEVWIDGKRAGETPLGNVDLPVGAHEVVFRHPELGERRVNAVVRADEPAKVTIDLRD